MPVCSAAILLAALSCSGPSRTLSAGRAVEVSAVPDPITAIPGNPVMVAWRFVLAAGWHLYWPGRNDSGYPPGVKLDLPEGWLAGELGWPVPERLIQPGEILDHVYHHELVILQELTPPATAHGGQRIAIPARITWLACREMCVPGDTTFTLELDLATERPADPEPTLITAARSRLPARSPLQEPGWRWDGTTLRVEMPGAARLTFFPDRDCGFLVDAIADGDARGEVLALRFRPREGVIGPVRGLLRREDDTGRAVAFEVTWPGPNAEQ